MLFFFHWVRNFEDKLDYDNNNEANLIHFYFSQKENELAIARIVLPRSSIIEKYGILSTKNNNEIKIIFRGVVTKNPLEFDADTISIELVSKSPSLNDQIIALDKKLNNTPYYNNNFSQSEDSSDILATRNLQYYSNPATGEVSISHISKGKRIITINKCDKDEIEFKYTQDPITDLELDITANWIYEKDEVHDPFENSEEIKGISPKQLIESWKKLQIFGTSKHYEIISSSLTCSNTGQIYYDSTKSIPDHDDIFSKQLDQIKPISLCPQLLLRFKQRQKMCEKISISITNPYIDHIPKRIKNIQYSLHLDRDNKIPIWSQHQFYQKGQTILHNNSIYQADIDHFALQKFSHAKWNYLREHNGELQIRSKRSFFNSYSGKNAIIHGILRAISAINISMRSIEVTIHGILFDTIIDLNLDDFVIYKDREFSICGKLISKDFEARFGKNKFTITLACEIGEKSNLEQIMSNAILNSFELNIENSQIGYCDQDYCEDYCFTSEDQSITKINDWIINHEILHMEDKIIEIPAPKITNQLAKSLEIIEASLGSTQELAHEQLITNYSHELTNIKLDHNKLYSEEAINYMEKILTNYQPEISLELPPISMNKLSYKEYKSIAILKRNCFQSGIIKE